MLSNKIFPKNSQLTLLLFFNQTAETCHSDRRMTHVAKGDDCIPMLLVGDRGPAFVGGGGRGHGTRGQGGAIL